MHHLPAWLLSFVLVCFVTVCNATIEVRNMISGRIYIIWKSELPSNSSTIRFVKHLISKQEGYEVSISQLTLFHEERLLWNHERTDQLIGCGTDQLKLQLLYKFVTVVVWTGYSKNDVFKLKVPLFEGSVWPSNITSDIAQFKGRFIQRIKSLIRQKIGVSPEQQMIKLKEISSAPGDLWSCKN